MEVGSREGGRGGNRDDVLRERVFELKVERVEEVESVCLGLRRRVCVRVKDMAEGSTVWHKPLKLKLFQPAVWRGVREGGEGRVRSGGGARKGQALIYDSAISTRI